MVNKNILFKIHEKTLFLSIVIAVLSIVISVLVFLLPNYIQPELTALIVCLAVISPFTVCIPLAFNRFEGNIDWFHPSILVLLVYFVYLIIPGIWIWLYHDYQTIWVNLGSNYINTFNSVFVIGIVSIYSFGFGMRAKPILLSKNHRKKKSRRWLLKWKYFPVIFLFFLLIGSLSKYYHLSLLGPFTIDIFQYLSPSAKRGLGINISQLNLVLESMLDWAALLSIFYLIINYKINRKKKWWFLVLLFTLIVSVLDYIVFAKRSVIIPFVLLPMIWYHYSVKRFSVNRFGVAILSILVISALFLMARILVPMLVQNLSPTDVVGKTPLEISSYYLDSPEFASFEAYRGVNYL